MGWLPVKGLARDIAIGEDGSLWCIGTDLIPNSNDYGIYRWNKRKDDWVKIPGGGQRIAVGKNGGAWIVNHNKEIWHYKTDRFVRAGRGLGTDIGNGGGISVIGTERAPGRTADCLAYRWNGSTWIRVDGQRGGVRIAGGDQPYVVTTSGDIYAFRYGHIGGAPAHWERLDGKARDIAYGSSGLYVIGTKGIPGSRDYIVCKMTSSGWAEVPGGGGRRAIASGCKGKWTEGVWIVNDNMEIWHYEP